MVGRKISLCSIYSTPLFGLALVWLQSTKISDLPNSCTGLPATFETWRSCMMLFRKDFLLKGLFLFTDLYGRLSYAPRITQS